MIYEVCKLSNETGNIAPDLAILRRLDLEGCEGVNYVGTAIIVNDIYYPLPCLVAGDLVQHPAWGKDQPNNYNGEQNCVVLDGGRGWLWNDVGCNLDYLHWICQHSYDPLIKSSHGHKTQKWTDFEI
ncbi:hypothetical protein NQ318_006274 [Aromia moschata]|uniref:C-type lectin domain-containing protein n=1 Tax=Aromia moschata TaxID=1265417 RepID=A0AAV8YXE8_9CUCU|nr:hypothetical protein NQ318_006274 [Aromia moschata]